VRGAQRGPGAGVMAPAAAAGPLTATDIIKVPQADPRAAAHRRGCSSSPKTRNKITNSTVCFCNIKKCMEQRKIF